MLLKIWSFHSALLKISLCVLLLKLPLMAAVETVDQWEDASELNEHEVSGLTFDERKWRSKLWRQEPNEKGKIFRPICDSCNTVKVMVNSDPFNVDITVKQCSVAQQEQFGQKVGEITLQNGTFRFLLSISKNDFWNSKEKVGKFLKFLYYGNFIPYNTFGFIPSHSTLWSALLMFLKSQKALEHQVNLFEQENFSPADAAEKFYHHMDHLKKINVIKSVKQKLQILMNFINDLKTEENPTNDDAEIPFSRGNFLIALNKKISVANFKKWLPRTSEKQPELFFDEDLSMLFSEVKTKIINLCLTKANVETNKKKSLELMGMILEDLADRYCVQHNGLGFKKPRYEPREESLFKKVFGIPTNKIKTFLTLVATKGDVSSKEIMIPVLNLIKDLKDQKEIGFVLI